LEYGAEARDHLIAALPVLQRLGTRSDSAGARAWLVLANLQIPDTVEAERWLDGLTEITLDDSDARSFGYDVGVRGEVLFARGEVEAGLRLWRRVVDQVRDAGSTGLPLDLDPWVVEARSVAVVAHARHGRLDLVADVAEALPARLTNLLTHPLVNPPPYMVEQAMCGNLLLAIAMADIARAGRTDDPAVARTGARMIALAERFRFLRNFQPTMSAASARADAERADRSAYDAAMTSYADLDPAGMRAVALDLLRGRRTDATIADCPAGPDQRVRSRL
jgi:hypothetical protein